MRTYVMAEFFSAPYPNPIKIQNTYIKRLDVFTSLEQMLERSIEDLYVNYKKVFASRYEPRRNRPHVETAPENFPIP